MSTINDLATLCQTDRVQSIHETHTALDLVGMLCTQPSASRQCGSAIRPVIEFPPVASPGPDFVPVPKELAHFPTVLRGRSTLSSYNCEMILGVST